jgi:hypothetical protein
VIAFAYYQQSWLLYVIRPKWSYRLNADFEDHAEHQYMLFVDEHSSRCRVLDGATDLACPIRLGHRISAQCVAEAARGQSVTPSRSMIVSAACRIIDRVI